MGLSDLWKGKKKTYSYNNPVFDYAQGYTPGQMSQYFNPNMNDFMGYGQYQGFNKLPAGLELLFQDRDIMDTDYRVMDPLSQQWKQFEEQNQIRDYLSQNASGQWATDLAGMDDAALQQYLNQQGWMKEAYDYGDPYQRSLYYTPYEIALGAETGNIPGMTATGKTANQNWASIHPNVGYDFWNNSTLGALGNLPNLSEFSLDPMQGVSNWQDPSVANWNQGFFSETNPWEAGVDADYEAGSGSYRTGGLFGVLGPILSFIPGLQWVGMIMSALNAAGHDNPLGVVTSFLPGLGQLGTFGTAAADMSQLMGQGLSATQAASIAGSAWNTSSSLLSGLNALGGLDSVSSLSSGFDKLSSLGSGISPYIKNPVIGGVSSELNGGNFATGALGGLVGTGVQEYISPAIKNVLTETGLSSEVSSGISNYLSGLGTNVATSYLSTLGDSDNYSESTSRLVSNTTPTQNMDSFTEGFASGFGLPQWMNMGNQQQQPQQQQARGRMTNNQLGGQFDPDKATQYMVG